MVLAGQYKLVGVVEVSGWMPLIQLIEQKIMNETPEARLRLLLPAILRMNLGLDAVAPSQAPEAAYTTMVLEHVNADDVLNVDLGSQVHEGLEDLGL